MSDEAWLIIKYHPLSLFTLKQSNASSKYAVTNLIPTPLVVKIAFMAAGFRKNAMKGAQEIFKNIKSASIRIKPPNHIIKQSQVKKVLQPSRSDDPLDQTVIMREYCFYNEPIEIAIQSSDNEIILKYAPYVRVFGKNDSMFQFDSSYISESLPDQFSYTIENPTQIPQEGIVMWLDDFTEKGINTSDLFARVNVYSSKTTRSYQMGKHRDLFPTLINVREERKGSNFKHYVTRHE